MNDRGLTRSTVSQRAGPAGRTERVHETATSTANVRGVSLRKRPWTDGNTTASMAHRVLSKRAQTLDRAGTQVRSRFQVQGERFAAVTYFELRTARWDGGTPAQGCRSIRPTVVTPRCSPARARVLAMRALPIVGQVVLSRRTESPTKSGKRFTGSGGCPIASGPCSWTRRTQLSTVAGVREKRCAVWGPAAGLHERQDGAALGGREVRALPSGDLRAATVLDSQLLAEHPELSPQLFVLGSKAHASDRAVGAPAADDGDAEVSERNRVNQAGLDVVRPAARQADLGRRRTHEAMVPQDGHNEPDARAGLTALQPPPWLDGSDGWQAGPRRRG